ncbi:MAG: Imm5 family immunity protein [Propionibacteriaceae bacterium]|nr:Imm5 family immunity protein [Propionibacteriaceae bacterium]
MTMAVTEAIAVARSEVAKATDATIPQYTRNLVWQALLQGRLPLVAARSRIARLELACVRHVQHIWDATYPGDPAVEQLLQLAEDLLAGRVELPVQDERMSCLEAFADWTRRRYGEDINDPAKAAAHHVLTAAWRACVTAEWAVGEHDGVIFRDDPDGWRDEDDDAWDRATDYDCACAVGGPSWEEAERIDLEARRKFWTWWLDVAVPQAEQG